MAGFVSESIERRGGLPVRELSRRFSYLADSAELQRTNRGKHTSMKPTPHIKRSRRTRKPRVKGVGYGFS